MSILNLKISGTTQEFRAVGNRRIAVKRRAGQPQREEAS